MKKVNISIVIPSYNSGKVIEKCLLSIKASLYDNYEIIVVDDCSTDNSPSIAKKYCDRFLELKKNSGPAYARNAGAKIAKGEILFFADADVEFYPDTLSWIARIFKDRNITVATGIYSKQPVNSGIAPLYKALFMYYHFTRKKIENYNIFSSSCGAVRRKIFLESGGFNTNIAWGIDLENDEFGHRLGKLHKNPVFPQIQVKHNFPKFLKLLKIMFTRTFYWTLLFFRRKKFDKAISTPLVGMSNAISPFILVFFVLIFFNLISIFISIFLLIVYFTAYAGFYLYVLKEKKYLEFFPIIFVAFTVSVSTGISAMAAFAKQFLVLLRLSKHNDKFKAAIQNL